MELVREGALFRRFFFFFSFLSTKGLKEGWQRSTEGGGRHGDRRAGGREREGVAVGETSMIQ